MKYRNIIYFLLGIFFLSACTDKEFYRGPLEDDNTPPGIVTGVAVKNLPGGALLTYQLPTDKDLWFVEAVYSRQEGEETSVKSSYYNNFIELEGFGNTDPRTVTLYAVDRGMNKSQPVEVEINPLEPPIYDVFRSLNMRATFGGVLFDFENENEIEISLVPLVIDSTGNWAVLGDTYFSKSKEGTFSVRGLDTLRRTFGLFASDKWGNVTDTIEAVLSPIFEKELDKSKFRTMNLPTDYNTKNTPNAGMASIWDGQNHPDGPADFTTLPGHGLPQWFTFDLGTQARLSRLKVWSRRHSRFLYQSGAVKKWEIWGSNNPDPDGSWDSWEYLATFTSVKPSGLPMGENTDEDLAFAEAGWDFDFPLDVPPVRYLRWKTLENWGDVSHITIVEINLYGQDE